ncbi:hypothetical protein [Salinibacterium sp. ZJ77]|uniref:hypothetical protein n=1 Tax=Salinibacterium sp. ZJ77 TaxID=2708337 RepID=UPI00141FA51B|nr:hypothetical protein [Salinibacterium sp. ZJ77]
MAKQEAQLEAWASQANEWGADIIAQIPDEELFLVSSNSGGSRQASALYAEWPKYYYWSQKIYLHPDGPRTTAEVADDLDVWLQSEGWVRNEAREMPPMRHAFDRSYYRDSYAMTVTVHTEPPPMAQWITFSISTPITDPDRD